MSGLVLHSGGGGEEGRSLTLSVYRLQSDAGRVETGLYSNISTSYILQISTYLQHWQLKSFQFVKFCVKKLQ